MPRKTKAQIAAEAAEEAARLLAEAEAEDEPEEESTGNDEVDAMLAAGYEAGESDVDDLDEEFDLSNVMDAEAAGDFDAFADTVTATCVKLESLQAKESKHRMLKLWWVVDEGPHAKAHIFDIIMLEGKGVGMAKRKVSQLGLAISTLKRSDLVNSTYEITTKIERDKSGEYDDKTVVKKYGNRLSGSGGTAEADEEALP